MTPLSPLRNPDATPLARKLAARVAADGPVSVHDYMEACLTDSEYGYYRTKAAIGQGGDFITSPEISRFSGNSSACGRARFGARWESPPLSG